MLFFLNRNPMSCLTFNFSVSNKALLADYDHPFQIMPATTNYINDSDIAKYKNAGISNPDILIHMNYITRFFSTKSIENDSRTRWSLRQYAKLADAIGTTNILVHMPKSSQELHNLAAGFKVIYDELLSKGFSVHFEIVSWTKELIAELQATKENCYELIVAQYTELFKLAKEFNVEDTTYVVIDTAHAYADGCDAATIIKLINTYRAKSKYVHLNGNCRIQFTSDSHVPMFSPDNKIIDSHIISEAVAKMDDLICVCEITKEASDEAKWVEYASTFGFKLVPKNKAASM